jgi:hypothetical protein
VGGVAAPRSTTHLVGAGTLPAMQKRRNATQPTTAVRRGEIFSNGRKRVFIRRSRK